MRQADIEGMDIAIGGRNISNIRYVDNTTLLADNDPSMRRVLHRVETTEKANFKLNADDVQIDKATL